MRLRAVFLVALFSISIAAAVSLYGQVYGLGNVVDSNGRYPSDRGRPWSTYGAKTDTSNLALQGAPGPNLSVFIYEAYCVNVSASTAAVALIKYSTTTVASINCSPASLNAVPTYFYPPLRFPANTAVTMNSPGSVTTLHLFASGTIAR